MDFTASEISAYYAARAPSLKQSHAREWRGRCPAHDGKDDNFSVNAETGMARCWSRCARGWDILGLEQQVTGWDFKTSKAEVFRLVGRPEVPWEDREIEATFDYTDETGKILYQVVRKCGKRFSQRRPDGTGGWTWGLGNAPQVPYRLPKVTAADLVAVVEGEKDVHSLERIGWTATCNNGGAGNFKPELARWFVGKHIAVFPDNDEPGRKHALKVAEVLHPVAASVRIVELPGLVEKGDVSDFLFGGGTDSNIAVRYERAQEWTPEWKFSEEIPNSEDRWLKTLAQDIDSAGGMDAFWNLLAQEGLPTPWKKLTYSLGGGLRRGEVYVIGSNQGAGKSSLALQFAIKILRLHKGVLLFSMEMCHRDVFQRMCSIEARVDLLEYRRMQQEFRAGRIGMGDEHFSDIRSALRRVTLELRDCPLIVSNRSRVTPKYIINESIRLRKRQGIELVIVDHLQLMDSTGNQRSDYEKFTAISRAMKATAMEIGAPVLLISQTSRSQSHDKRTELEVSDLRGTGAIEEDAAAVMLLYPVFEDAKRHLTAGTYQIGPVQTVLKNGKCRYGWQGSELKLLHYKRFTRFEEIDNG